MKQTGNAKVNGETLKQEAMATTRERLDSYFEAYSALQAQGKDNAPV